jgi:large conductance mechanosensitive channel
MGMVQEFKDFAFKGNMIDLAVGVVIGGAFGKVVTALVDNIIMTPLNLFLKDFQFKDLVLGNEKSPFLKPGAFLQEFVNFLIIAFAIFMVVKMINGAKKRFEKEAAAAPPPPPTEDVVLLRQIRDALVKK